MIITLDVTAQCEENRAGVEQVIGYVYLDENKDLVKDEGDRGLPDISVSNGCSVVQTDQNGRYEIRHNSLGVKDLEYTLKSITDLKECPLSV